MDPSPGGCSASEHLCGETCTPRLANDPENGCELGCDDPCPVPSFGLGLCRDDGTCDFECVAPRVRMGTECVLESCVAAGLQCGELMTAEGPQACGSCGAAATCVDNLCAIEPDASEPNDSAAAATPLTSLVELDFNSPPHGLSGHSIGSSSDEDWYKFRWEDSAPPASFGWGPRVLFGQSNELSGLDAQHELTVWFKCDDANNLTVPTCSGGPTAEVLAEATDPTLGVGCTVRDLAPEAKVFVRCMFENRGTVTIRVRRPADSLDPRGGVYGLEWSARKFLPGDPP